MLRAPPSRSSEHPPGPRSAQPPQVARAAQAHGGAHDSVRPRRRRVPRAWLVGGGVGFVVLLVVGLLAFGPIVRSRVAKEGERRRLDVTVGSVRPGFFAVNLKDVHVKLQGVSGLEVRIDDVHVDLTTGLSVREIAAHGGEIRVEGEPEDVVDRLRAFQKGGAAQTAGEKGHRMPVSADALTLAWKLPAEGEISGSALKLSRGGRRHPARRAVGSPRPTSARLSRSSAVTSSSAPTAWRVASRRPP